VEKKEKKEKKKKKKIPKIRSGNVKQRRGSTGDVSSPRDICSGGDVLSRIN